VTALERDVISELRAIVEYEGSAIRASLSLGLNHQTIQRILRGAVPPGPKIHRCLREYYKKLSNPQIKTARVVPVARSGFIPPNGAHPEKKWSPLLPIGTVSNVRREGDRVIADFKPEPKPEPKVERPPAVSTVELRNFAFDQSTTGAHRFKELTEEGGLAKQDEALVGTLYLRKSAVGDKAPKSVTIVVQIEY
jgi:hypothetical protein